MPRYLYNMLGRRVSAVLHSKLSWPARILFYGLYTLSTTCDAATLTPQAGNSVQPLAARHQQLTEVWRKAFPLADDGMAPLSSTRGFPTSKPTAPWAGVRTRQDRPHPAVARIVVPEEGAISYGSGTLIDVRDNFGLVITNWHVVRDASETIEVIFPDGFTSKARALKVDTDWDLAALVIWRPESIEPVSIAATAPQPGDQLTICGYGQGNYRSATGRCTQYYAPRLDFPRHMVELDVEARQGDSGGPIFNMQGELAGVLFGAGQGTTLGSFGGRVGAFLATLAPDIGRAEESLAENSGGIKQPSEFCQDDATCAAAPQSQRAATLRPHEPNDPPREFAATERIDSESVQWPSSHEKKTALADSPDTSTTAQMANHTAPAKATRQPADGRINLFEQMKTALAAVGLVTIVVQMLRVAR